MTWDFWLIFLLAYCTGLWIGRVILRIWDYFRKGKP